MAKKKYKRIERRPSTEVKDKIRVLKKSVRKDISQGRRLSNSDRDPEQEAREIQIRIAQLEKAADETAATTDRGARKRARGVLETQVNTLSRRLKSK